MSVKVTGFERLKDNYESCPDFGELYTSLSNIPRPILDDYTLQYGYLFKANKLCIPRSSVRDFLVWEIHAGEALQVILAETRQLRKWNVNSIGLVLRGVLPR